LQAGTEKAGVRRRIVQAGGVVRAVCVREGSGSAVEVLVGSKMCVACVEKYGVVEKR